MEFVRLTQESDARYGPAMALYAASFPLHEQRLPASQAAALAHMDYHFDLIYESDAFAGLLLYWETADFLYVEHFCMLPTLRGQGGGARALDCLAQRGKPVILEIDPPVDEISQRRRGFYLRSGFCENPFAHVHPPYRQAYPGHALVVLSQPQPLTEDGYRAFAAYLQDTVMGC